MAEERKIKGRVLKSYGKFIKKKWGQQGLNDCMKATGADLVNVGDDVWYPNDHSEKTQAWIVDTHGLQYCRMMGRTITTEIGIISYVARIAGIKRVIDNATNEVKNSVFHSNVESKLVEGGADIIFKDLNRNEAQCETMTGILEGLLELTKKKGTVQEATCEVKGGDTCTYEIRWQ